MSGKRFKSTKQKLNIKRVILVIILPILIFIISYGVTKIFETLRVYKVKRTNPIMYFSSYLKETSKWGVIDTNGNTILDNIYNNMVIIPNNKYGLFIISNNSNNKIETTVVNKDRREILTKYKEISPIEYSKTTHLYDQNLLKYKENNLYGLIDYTGNIKFNSTLQEINIIPNIENKIIIKENNLYGVINTATYKKIIPNIYKEIIPITNNENTCYIVKYEDKYGVISSTGQKVLESIYDKIHNVNSLKYIVAEKQGEINIYDLEGKVVFTKPDFNILDIQDNSIIAQKNNLTGIISFNNEEILPYKYQTIKRAGVNQYIVQENNTFNIALAYPISKDVTKQQKDNLKALSKEYFNIVFNDTGNFYFAQEKSNSSTVDIYDKDLQLQLTGIISKINNEKGFFALKKENNSKLLEYYLFNFHKKEESEIFPTNNLYMFESNGKIGYKNNKNEEIVKPIYDDGFIQNEFGYLVVSRENKWGVLDHEGNVILEPSLNFTDFIKIDFIKDWYLDKNLELNTYIK